MTTTAANARALDELARRKVPGGQRLETGRFIGNWREQRHRQMDYTG